MRTRSSHWSGTVLAMLVALVAGCAERDAPPTAATQAATLTLSAEARVQGLSITVPGEAALDTVVTLGGVLQLAVTATDAGGRGVAGVVVRWASGDSTVATFGDGGALQVHRSGLVQLTATVGTVTQARAFPVVLIDGAAVREVLEDPLVARLVTGLSPTVGARVQAALSASAGALNAGAAATLRTLGANVAQTLRGAEDPADRAVLAVLELYVHQLELALTLSSES